jgi:copper resistance protein C
LRAWVCRVKGSAMRPGHRIIPAVCFVAAIVLLFVTRAALAHAILLESSPAANSTVAGPDIPVKLRFNVRIDTSRSRLILIRPDASTQSLLISKGSSPDILASHAQGLNPGAYRIRWQALASDGHITRGEILFQVAQP